MIEDLAGEDEAARYDAGQHGEHRDRDQHLDQRKSRLALPPSRSPWSQEPQEPHTGKSPSPCAPQEPAGGVHPLVPVRATRTPAVSQFTETR